MTEWRRHSKRREVLCVDFRSKQGHTIIVMLTLWPFVRNYFCVRREREAGWGRLLKAELPRCPSRVIVFPNMESRAELSKNVQTRVRADAMLKRWYTSRIGIYRAVWQESTVRTRSQTARVGGAFDSYAVLCVLIYWRLASVKSTYYNYY